MRGDNSTNSGQPYDSDSTSSNWADTSPSEESSADLTRSLDYTQEAESYDAQYNGSNTYASSSYQFQRPLRSDYGQPATGTGAKIALVLVAVLLIGVAAFLLRPGARNSRDVSAVDQPVPSGTATDGQTSPDASIPSPSSQESKKDADGPAVPADRVLAPTTASNNPAEEYGAQDNSGTAVNPAVEPRSASEAATNFLKAWQSRNYSAMQALLADPRYNAASIFGNTLNRLRVSHIEIKPLDSGASGSMRYSVRMALRGFANPWGYESSLNTTRNAQGRYRVVYAATVVHPDLRDGQYLDLLPAGKGIELTFRDRTTPLSTSQDLASNVAGKPATSTNAGSGLYRVVAQLNPQAADAAFQGGARVAVVDRSGAMVKQVATFAPVSNSAGGGLATTTFDVKTQRAAEAAVASAPGVAAVVAIDASNGEVRALANKPTTGIPPAIGYGYAPGSTFKIITATAALRNGLRPASSVPCLARVQLGTNDWVRNYEGETCASKVSFLNAFTHSYNTSFIRIALDNMTSADLKAAAEMYGFNMGQPLPIKSFGGSIPLPPSKVDRAYDAIGQGRVQASPLQMASVAGGAATGVWHQPRIMACPTCASRRVPNASSLSVMMRSVVTSGTGTALRGVPGGQVYGKTGTAEYGTRQPLPTHAWFVGYQSGMAFAVFVHDGRSGGGVAAPIAANFLRQLRS